MNLKSIELNGFKSFAQKTALEFPHGITAIVGPNGSGKSNVIDAIRWILGEREAKNLRGTKAEDLIFAGTPKRPRVGMANVAIHFDNQSRFFPVDFDEVTIMRQITRDGDSKYLINKSEVKAKDIIDFFARSRLGTKGITIINQGSSDLFVRVTPQERKAMLEEILGLREYQLKKHDAERKLKNTEANLEKVGVMLEEVLPRLRMLKRQVSKYESRSQKEDELKKLEDGFFAHKLHFIKKSFDHNRQIEKELAEKISAKERELTELEKNLQKIESSFEKPRHDPHEQQKENELLQNRSHLQKEIGRIEAKIEFARNLGSNSEIVFKKEEFTALLKELKKDLENILEFKELEQAFSAIKTSLGKIAEILKEPEQKNTHETNELQKVQESLSKELETIESELKNIRLKQNTASKTLENFNTEFRAAFEKKESKKEEKRALEDKKRYTDFEIEKMEIKLQELKNDWNRAGRPLEELENLKIHEDLSPVEMDENERRIMRIRAELMAIGEIDHSLIAEAAEVERHYAFLSRQSEDLQKGVIDLKNLIEELRKEINTRFTSSFKTINEEFNKFFRLMFNGGSAKMKIKEQKIAAENLNGEETENKEQDEEQIAGVEIELNLPKKRITSLDVLSGGEKSLVSIAALFALISVSPPPFLVLDEIDSPLDEKNSKRFAELIKEFAKTVQFILVTHNRTVMEAADVLYGVTMNEDGTSKLLSLKFSQ